VADTSVRHDTQNECEQPLQTPLQPEQKKVSQSSQRVLQSSQIELSQRWQYV
jgi:hypothetical protein